MFRVPQATAEDDDTPLGPIPYIDTGKAIKLEVELTREDPIGARDWYLAADKRLASWQASPFFAGFEKLFARKSTVGYDRS